MSKLYSALTNDTWSSGINLATSPPFQVVGALVLPLPSQVKKLPLGTNQGVEASKGKYNPPWASVNGLLLSISTLLES